METNDKDKLIDECIRRCTSHMDYFREVRHAPDEVEHNKNLIKLLFELKVLRKQVKGCVSTANAHIRIEENYGNIIIE